MTPRAPGAASGSAAGGRTLTPRAHATIASGRRRDAILDSAARVVEASGSDGLTSALVAEGAGIGLSAVYRHYSGRVALLVALGSRNESRLTTCLEAAFLVPSSTRDAAVDTLFATLVEHFRSEPGMRSVGTGDGIDVGPDSPRTQWEAVAAPAIDALATRHGTPRGLASAAVATVCVMSHALLHVAFRDDRNGEPSLLRIARGACHSMMRQALDRPSFAVGAAGPG